jgi:hypothetical protein
MSADPDRRRHPEVRAIFGAPRRMVFSVVFAAILRGAQETARTSRVNAIAFIPGMTVGVFL